MNKLYHVVTNKIKNKDQQNDIIVYQPGFDSKFILSRSTKDPLPVVTVSIQLGKKRRATIISSLKCLRGS